MYMQSMISVAAYRPAVIMLLFAQNRVQNDWIQIYETK
jgi:hypothetical protein